MQSLAGSPAYNTPSRPDPAHRIYLQTYEVDTRSIFVGQLPPDTFEEELEQKFEHCGQILRVTVHKNDSLIDGEFTSSISSCRKTNDLEASQKHCFAFIEFADIRSSHQAIEKMVSSFSLHAPTRTHTSIRTLPTSEARPCVFLKRIPRQPRPVVFVVKSADLLP
jgi:RNA recognition motif-containing protein